MVKQQAEVTKPTCIDVRRTKSITNNSKTTWSKIHSKSLAFSNLTLAHSLKHTKQLFFKKITNDQQLQVTSHIIGYMQNIILHDTTVQKLRHDFISTHHQNADTLPHTLNKY